MTNVTKQYFAIGIARFGSLKFKNGKCKISKTNENNEKCHA